jgi:pimeloyl-ACP methyl ester carboxylesterase
MTATGRTIKTSRADIAISETSGKGLPVLLLHGNSSRKEVFARLMNSAVGEKFRLIAMDLPGHGASSDARDPAHTYTMPGYAEAAVELLGEMGIERAAVFGWSLGGHVAMEMIPRFHGLVGLMVSGAPPVGQGAEKVMAGFKPNPHAGLVGKPDLTAEEKQILIYATYGGPVDALLRDAVTRTDGRARAVMFESLLTGTTSDQRAFVENTDIPIAIVNGADDPLVNLAYVGGLAYRSLWDNHCFVLRGAAHAPFLQATDTFNAIFSRFVSEMQKRADQPQHSKQSKIAAA